jgi:hypothetical protein
MAERKKEFNFDYFNRVVGLPSKGLDPKHMCCNPSLGFATKVRAYKVAGQEGSLGLMLHAPKNARECEGIDPHTPKGTPTLGVKVPVDFKMFKERFQGSKPNLLRNYLYHWKAIET